MFCLSSDVAYFMHVQLKEPRIQPGEIVSISLLALDQLNNTREAVWSLEAPGRDAVSYIFFT